MIDSGLCSFPPDISSRYCRKISGHLLRASQMFILPAFRAGDHGSCSTIVPSNLDNIKNCLNIESGRRNLYLRKMQNFPSIILPQSFVFHLHLVLLHSFSALFSPSTSLGKVKPSPSLGEDNPRRRRWTWTSQQHCLLYRFVHWTAQDRKNQGISFVMAENSVF